MFDTKPASAWLLMALTAVAASAQEAAPADPAHAASQRGVEAAAAAPTQLERGRAALEAGRLEQAVAEFRLAVEQSPESAEARLGLGSALANLRRHEEAMEQYQRAAEIAPDDAEPWLRMGDVLAAEQRIDEALVHFRQAIERDPEAESARLSEAQILHMEGRFDEVVARLEEAHEMLPASGRVAYGLAWMLAASPDASVRDGARALELAETIFASEQLLQNAELVAEALAELDRCQEAAEWMRGFADSIAESEPPPVLVERLQRDTERFAEGPPCRAAVEKSAAADE